VTPQSCPICAARDPRFRLKAYDDRYACPGRFDIYYCRQCAHAFVAAADAAPEEERLYTDYYPRAALAPAVFKPKAFAGGVRSWLNGDDSAACRWVPAGVRVLDVGCGFGETLAYLVSRGCEAYGVELDGNVRRIADNFGLKIHIGPFDPALYPPGSFDYVTLQQVIEHVDDPVGTLRGVAAVLRPGGHAVLSTPNAGGWGARLFGRRWINWHVPYHRHVFSPVSLQAAARAAGFDVVSVRTVTSSEWLRFQWAHLVTFPAAGAPSPFWSPLGKRTPAVRVAQRLLDLAHIARINHLATRLFDSLGEGDNLLVVLRKPACGP
jgi:SAM-dependent methyltransferase